MATLIEHIDAMDAEMRRLLENREHEETVAMTVSRLADRDELRFLVTQTNVHYGLLALLGREPGRQIRAWGADLIMAARAVNAKATNVEVG